MCFPVRHAVVECSVQECQPGMQYQSQPTVNDASHLIEFPRPLPNAQALHIASPAIQEQFDTQLIVDQSITQLNRLDHASQRIRLTPIPTRTAQFTLDTASPPRLHFLRTRRSSRLWPHLHQ